MVRTMEQRRGLDGLTSEELRASRQGWWDESFTSFLLRWIPEETHSLIDVGCGLAVAAHALLPFRKRALYLGIDADESRLREAQQLCVGAAYAGRVKFQPGRAEQLPCPDFAADLVLSSMTLQHVMDTSAALSEIKRVLCPQGRFIAIEPDNLSNQFYFDGLLEELNAAFRNLFAAGRDARRPADIAIGPALPAALEKAGFTVIDCRPYALGRMSRLRAGEFFERARRVALVLCSVTGLPSDNAALEECLTKISCAAAAVGSETLGYGCHVAPLFVTVAERKA